MSSRRSLHLTPAILLQAYAAGIFPMAENANSHELRWFDPPLRAIIPLDSRFHVPSRLRRTIRKHKYTVRLNTSFSEVIRSCAAARPERPITWINDEIIRLYIKLHHLGHAHSVEIWDGHHLAGGLYGASLGGAFFGESMFSLKPDTSKIALVYLVALLRHCGFVLLDTQFQTDHLARFGTFEITRAHYHHLLAGAIEKKASLTLSPGIDWDRLVYSFLQPVTHRS